MKTPGAWWHPDNVDNVLALRMLKANDGWWEGYWDERHGAWRDRAVTFTAPRLARAA